jgi:hypothetical protein
MGSGFFSELFTLVGQWGTPDVDPPAHFIKGLRTFDQMVINAAEKSAPVGLTESHGTNEGSR